ncbi:MAG: protein kinase [Gammaproteobacteria bacterium]|nr:protein kinase [Gammaproteobacteria bacterium]
MQGLSAGLTISDRFTLARRLGGGGMGEVWLADDRELADRVALKLLDPRFAESPGFVDLLRRECSQARSLVHPNIVRVFDFHATDERYFISMQYVDGDTLIASRGSAFQKIVHQVLMVCDALAYAHRAGVVHRDVKTSNVLVDRNGICYLTDFGIASLMSSAGDDKGVAIKGGGTLPSMSPQQLAGLPAAVSDDVYSLGAMLYELISGEPLFHPNVAPERIRAEQPTPLTMDKTGQPLPESLVKLVAAMLSKAPEQRPAGIGAVRSVLEDIHADFPLDSQAGADFDQPIRPISRRTTAPAVSEDGATTAPRRRAEAKDSGLSPTIVYGALAALLMVAVVVIFLLPNAVQERRQAGGKAVDEQPVQQVEQTETGGAASASNAAGLAVKREIADEILGELLVAQDRLRAVGVAVWGGDDWADAEAAVATGDDAYQDRRFDEAVTSYRQALNTMKILEPRAPEILARALADGAAAINAGDSEAAEQNFQLALAVDPVNDVARTGLARAARLDDVIALTRQAADVEQAGDLSAAAGLYEQALDVDPEWTPAPDGLSRTRSGVAQLSYEKRMAAGFGALADKQFERAREAFNAALSTRPGDADATAALRQVETEARLAEVIRLQARARIAETGEDWAAAVGHYEAILAIDPAVTSAKQNLERARQRSQLAASLDSAIAKADLLNDERVARNARNLLGEARAVASPGPVLSGQIGRLDELLTIASVPVRVLFQSDNATEVVIYKVGSLGAFETRAVDLRPGRYVAVGSRAGYRDVRRSFLVMPQGTDGPIELSCKEPI